MGDGWRKAAKMLTQTSHWNRIRKPRSLQFCKTEIITDFGGEKKRNKRRIYGLLVNGRDLHHYTENRSSRERVKDSFTRLIHSCQCHFIHIYVYMYVCIYNFLWIILIPSLWSELLEVRWQSLAKISWFHDFFVIWLRNN